MRETRRTWARAALGGVLAVTAAWWALALWPLPASAPDWLSRTRAVCFGSTPSGLPDVQGWMLLFLQPTLMLAQVLAIWGGELKGDASRMSRSRRGRMALGVLVIAFFTAAGAAVTRVRGATEASASAEGGLIEPGWVRVGRPAPPLELLDADGAPLRLAELRGRPVFVAFAFAHCQTACPRLVHEVLVAQRALGDPAVIVVTLDPWRDTPSRLRSIEERWEMGEGARVASGSVGQVEAALDAWGIERSRDPRNGDLVHVPRVFVVDREGILAYEADPNAALLAELARPL
ncbi:MAG TPA: SCO family protein [Gemmatimonadota bacterium]|nr:SCO family protein [Gemmatimonadota bacterium]